jgi:hypothetical protein
MSHEGALADDRTPYVGWIAAGIILVVTFAAAGVVWFIFHP